MKTALLQLSEIVTTAGTQIRACLDNSTVDDYATAMVEGAVFPPVVVFHDGTRYILADGFHRVMAATRNGFKDIESEVHKGAKSDALKYALGANAKHGLKRTPSDKRRSAQLALAEWPRLSDIAIAEICAISHHTVADERKSRAQLGKMPSSTSRIGRDGKERKLPASKPNQAEPKLAEVKEPEPTPTTNDSQWKSVLPNTKASDFEAPKPKDLEEARMEIIMGHLGAVEEGLEVISKQENRDRIKTACNRLASIARHESQTPAAA